MVTFFFFAAAAASDSDCRDTDEPPDSALFTLYPFHQRKLAVNSLGIWPRTFYLVCTSAEKAFYDGLVQAGR